jgi:hypothetical protein
MVSRLVVFTKCVAYWLIGVIVSITTMQIFVKTLTCKMTTLEVNLLDANQQHLIFTA